MATRKRGTTRVDAPKSRVDHIEGDRIKVGREIGLTVAVTDDPPQFIRISSWEERLCSGSTQTDIDRLRRRMDESLEKDVERAIRDVKHLLNTVEPEDDEEPEPKRKSRKGSARDRARKRAGYG